MGEILPATTFNFPHSTGTFFSLSGGTWHFSLFQPFWNFLGFHNSTLPDFQLFSHWGVQVLWALAARAPCLMPYNKHQHFLSPQPSVRRLVRGPQFGLVTNEHRNKWASLVVLVVGDLLGNAGDARDWILAFNPWVRKIPLEWLLCMNTYTVLICTNSSFRVLARALYTIISCVRIGPTEHPQ